MMKSFSKFLVILATVGGVGCLDQVKTGKSTKHEMEQTELNHERLVKAVPPPRLNDSLERRNLVRRLEHINKPNQISYIYLVSYGKIMAFYTVKGKVSSLNSLLTTPMQIVTVSNGNTHTAVTIPSPDFDGSYGQNPDGIFFFTTEDVYVEWRGDFLWADQPLKLSQPPELVLNVDDKKPAPPQSVLPSESLSHKMTPKK